MIFSLQGRDSEDAARFKRLLETGNDDERWQVRRDVSHPLYAYAIAHNYPRLRAAIVADMIELASAAHVERGSAEIADLERAGYSLAISERYGPNPHAYSGPGRFAETGS